MREPVRGASDVATSRVPHSSQPHRDEWDVNRSKFSNLPPLFGKAIDLYWRTSRSFLDLFRNAPYLYATFGMAMVTFSLGGISAWMPSFLERSGFSPSTVGLTLGGITAATGLGGTAFGGWLAQRWLRTNHQALYLVSAWSALLTVPFGVLCFFGPRVTMLPALGLAMFCIFLGTGPLNAAIVNSVPAAIRATAMAMEIFLIHAVGDTPSPRLIGIISDHSNLATGLGLTLVTMLIATVLLFLGARTATPKFA
jgi:MFS family permease